MSVEGWTEKLSSSTHGSQGSRCPALSISHRACCQDAEFAISGYCWHLENLRGASSSQEVPWGHDASPFYSLFLERALPYLRAEKTHLFVFSKVGSLPSLNLWLAWPRVPVSPGDSYPEFSWTTRRFKGGRTRENTGKESGFILPEN